MRVPRDSKKRGADGPQPPWGREALCPNLHPLPKSAPPQEVSKSAPLCAQHACEAPPPAETSDRAPPDFLPLRRPLAPALRPTRGDGVPGDPGSGRPDAQICTPTLPYILRPDRRSGPPGAAGSFPSVRRACSPPARGAPRAPRPPVPLARMPPLYPYIRAYTRVWGFV